MYIKPHRKEIRKGLLSPFKGIHCPWQKNGENGGT
jgi:hypothetical protein